MRYFQWILWLQGCLAIIFSISATPQTGWSQGVPVIQTIVGEGEDFPGDGGPATLAYLSGPVNLHVDPLGNVYIVDWSDNRVRKIDAAGIITTFAGTGNADFSGDGGPATLAEINDPIDIEGDAFGNIYIADESNHRIRMVDPTGIITTIAGTGVADHTGDGGPATLATLNDPSGVTLDGAGNIYISEMDNHIIRKIDGFGIITTIAGTPGTPGFSGDGGPATLAQLDRPTAVAVDGIGNVYFTEENNNTIRKISPDGTLTRIAGTGEFGFSGDGGPATLAQIYLWWPTGLEVDGGDLYFTDTSNNRIRKIDASGIITTIAGTGEDGFAGDGGPATLALLDDPMGLDIDTAGNIYFPEWSNSTVRKITVDPATSLHFTESFGRPDGLAVVNLELLNDAAVSGLQFKINAMDGEGEPSDYARLDGIINDIESYGFSVFHSVDQITQEATVLVVNIDGGALEPGRRTVLSLVYHIESNTPYGTWIDLQVSDVVASDPNANPLGIDDIHEGSIHIGEPGDITGGVLGDGDGQVNILDVVAVVQYLLGVQPDPEPGSFAFWVVDLNGDEALDVRDLVLIIRRILVEDGENPALRAVASAPTQPVVVSLDDVVASDQGHQAVPVRLESDGALAGLQAAFTFDPARLKIGTPRLVGHADGMTLQYRLTDRELHILIYSVAGRVLPAGSGTVLLLPVTIIDEVVPATVTLVDVLLADVQAQAIPVTLGETSARVSATPTAFALTGNAPNPFNPSTTIAYAVSAPAHITLAIYNLLGQEVARLVDQAQTPGRYRAVWQGRNAQGQAVASGVYLYRLTSSTGFSNTRRMTLLK